MSHRTTLTLDDDVAARLEREARQSGRSYRAVVNDALRRGLDAMPVGLEPFVVDAQALGARQGLELDDVFGLLDRLDGASAR